MIASRTVLRWWRPTSAPKSSPREATTSLPSQTRRQPSLDTVSISDLHSSVAVERRRSFKDNQLPQPTRPSSPLPALTSYEANSIWFRRMIVYLPNSDPSGITNTSTGQLIYPDAQALSILDTSFNLTTRGDLTAGLPDSSWSTCLACAVIERTRGTQGVDRTGPCGACFGRYCWNETEWVYVAPGSESGGGREAVGGVAGGLVLALAAWFL